jgi:hypothetical protein
LISLRIILPSLSGLIRVLAVSGWRPLWTSHLPGPGFPCNPDKILSQTDSKRHPYRLFWVPMAYSFGAKFRTVCWSYQIWYALSALSAPEWRLEGGLLGKLAFFTPFQYHSAGVWAWMACSPRYREPIPPSWEHHPCFRFSVVLSSCVHAP